MSTHHVKVLVLLALITACGEPPSPAGSDGSNPSSPADAVDGVAEFRVTSHYQLVDDAGEALQGRFYESVISAQLLFTSPAESFVVDARRRQVRTIDADAIEWMGDMEARLASSVGTVAGRFDIVDDEPVLTLGQRRLRLAQAPPLVGPATRDRLIEHSPEYGLAAEEYRPSEELIDAVAEHARSVRVIAVFGSWCPACQRFLPFLVRVDQELAARSADVDVEYYGIEAPPDGWQDARAVDLGVRALPTAIVLVRAADGERELGRFVGPDGFRRPESELGELLGVVGRR